MKDQAIGEMNKNSFHHAPKISLLLVNYKTRYLTGLCLKLIKERFADSELQVIVVDNDSDDESLAHLKSLEWIELIERKVAAHEPGHVAHACALDLGMAAVTSKYVLIMHSDTLIKNPLVLNFLLNKLQEGETVCAGSVDQRDRSMLSRIWRKTKRTLRGYSSHGSCKTNMEKGKLRASDEYIKSFCCLWEVSVIRNLGLKFCAADRNPGYQMQDELLSRGYKLGTVKPKELFQYVAHIQSGTQAETGLHGKNHRRSVAYQNLITEYSSD